MLENPSTWLRLAKDLIAGCPARLRSIAGAGILLLAVFLLFFRARRAVDALQPTILTPVFAIGLEIALLVLVGLVVVILVLLVIYAFFYRAP